MTKPKTVLLTGASGYIAKHIALKLLNAGYNVVGSVRSLSRADEVIAALKPHLDSTDNLDARLRFVALDLSSDEGWSDAMRGIDILMHTASPFPLEQPKNEDDLIRPAVDGALRALRTASKAGIKRVVMTSSVVAVIESDLPPGKTAYDEADWSDPDRANTSPYTKSKTLAERAAWDFVRDQAPDIALTVINPALVTGPPLDANFGSSVSVVQRVLRSKDPMLPRFGMGCVDVRVVAEMHLKCLNIPASEGKRIMAVERFIWYGEIAETLQQNFPDRRITTRLAPNFIVRILAIFDKSIRIVLPNLGLTRQFDNARARDLLGMQFIPAPQSITDTATYLIQNDLVG
ncbi:MAG: SDR family oxidoreductase [Paracoccaceae bacterium]